MRSVILAAFALPLCLTAQVQTAAAQDDRVLALPGDYRTNFTKYLISDRMNQDDQVIALYANEIARNAAQAGVPLPDGSILIGEIYKAKLDENGDVAESMLSRRIPEERISIVMMERRAEWAGQYPDDLKVGGWEFETFSPDGVNLSKDTAACRECHQPLDTTEYLWSLEHLAAAD